MSTLSKIVGGVLLVAAAAAAAVGGVAIAKLYNEGKINLPFVNNSSEETVSVDNGHSNNSSTQNNNGMSTTIRASGVAVKMLSEGVNASGQTTKTFSYEVTPSNATNQDVSARLAWSNPSVSAPISNYLTATINKNNKTITVTAKEDFAYQATLTVESDENASKYALVTIDCLEKHLGWKTEQAAPHYDVQYTYFSGEFRSNWGHAGDYVTYGLSNATRGPWSISSFDLGNSTVYSVSQTINKEMYFGLSTNNKRSCKLVVFGVNGSAGVYYEGSEITNNDTLNADSAYRNDFGVENILPNEIDADELTDLEDDIRDRIEQRISSLNSATKAELSRLSAASNANYFYKFGFKVPCTIYCSASTGATAEYSRYAYILYDMSQFTF